MKANYNWDKGAENVFSFTSDYDVECWEFKNNTSEACLFTGEIPTNWSEDFEARYPDKYSNISRLKSLHDWILSTKQSAATGNVLSATYTDIDGNTHTTDTAAYRLAKFKTEFENHFNMHYALIYYVYTFFALMVDQRAKNMFLTYWGSTGQWYFYFYDNDTAFGINNEGGLSFDYYHEDHDQVDGANVYNGQLSTLWVNFRQAFPDLIQETYQDLRNNSVLNYEELIDQFITKGSDKWSESIYNEDGDFKYISMLRSNNDATNLPQVRGTGEEHLRYFIENRLNYCDSKWYAGEYISRPNPNNPSENINNFVTLRIYTPVDEAGNPRTDLAVPASADITLTPYSHMYGGVRYKANGTLLQHRLEANETYTFEAPNEVFNDTETAIYGAPQLSSLGNLAPLYLGYLDVGAATKLVELKIGDSTPGYQNSNLYHLAVGTNRLLKKIDIQNCVGFDQALVLTGCPNIEEVYAKGSSITGVELPNSGYLKVLQLPATITNLTLKNQPYIEDLTIEGYENLKTITIENCPVVDSLDMLDKAINVERVRLTNVDWHYDDASILYELIDRDIGGIDENGINTDTMWIDGKCHIKALSGAEYLKVKEAFPYLTITYDSLTAQLTFKSEDGSEDYGTQTIQNGGDGNYTGTTPTKPSTAQYTYTFGGWSLTPGGEPDPNALKNVEADRIVYAAFNKELRKYTVKFYNGTTLLQTVTEVPYGSNATYSGSTPVNNSSGNPADFEFYGWKPAPTNIQGDTNCYAQFHDLREITDSWATIAANVTNGTATSKYAIGAYKTLDITHDDGTTESIPMQVIAHNHDELPDGVTKWEGLAKIPYDFYRGYAVTLNNEIHILGSYGGTGNQHYKWNGSAWTSVSTLPYSFDYGSAVVYNNEIHILGCSDADTSHYKWTGTEWVEVSTLPYNFYRGVAVVFNNEIHIMGSAHTSYRLVHYKWDGSAWTSVGAPPYGVQDTAAVVLNNEIHILGSYMNGSRTAHYKYDGSAWTQVSTIPYDFYSGSAVMLNNEIHILGSNSTVENRTNHYKWNGTNWIEDQRLPFDFYDGCALAYNGRVTIVGSYTPGYNKKFVQLAGASWVEYTVAKPGFNQTCCVVHNDELHMLGGYSNNNGHYKFVGKEIEVVSTTPETFYAGYGRVSYNGEIHVFTNNAVHYKWDGTEWSIASTLPTAITGGCSAVVYNDEIYICNATAGYYKWNGTEWAAIPGINRKSAIKMFVYNERIYVMGYFGGNMECYFYDGTEWSDNTFQSSSLKNGISNNMTTVIVYDNDVYVGCPTAIEKWDGVSTWTVVDDMPVSSLNHLCVLKQHIVSLQESTVYRYENPRATLTFLAGNLLKDDREFSSSKGGWGGLYSAGDRNNGLYKHLHNTILPLLDSSLQNSIKSVKKMSDYGEPGRIDFMITTDKLWSPSPEEIGCDMSSFDGSVYYQGDPYSIFTDNASRIRTKVNGEAVRYLTRSRDITNGNVFYINIDGTLKTVAWHNSTSGILFGFCI